jgi:hypothetical protein
MICITRVSTIVAVSLHQTQIVSYVGILPRHATGVNPLHGGL